MKSPFPGMDPYLERHWGDVHHRLVMYLADALQPRLPDDLVVRAEERIFVNSEREARGYRGVYPDVRVVESEPMPVRPAPAATTAAVAVAEPMVIELLDEARTEGFLRVTEVATERVVTTIEVLSPTNKRPGDGARQYRQKQVELEASGIGLVEVDLVRAGQWVVRAPERKIRPEGRAEYRACVTRGWDQDRAIYYPLPLRQPLPAILIPLREADAEVAVELQPLVDQAYRNGRYVSIDYRQDADPPLTGEDAAWAD